MIYSVAITETLSRTITVEAITKDDAVEEVMQKYKAGEIVLDADDFAEVFFRVKKR